MGCSSGNWVARDIRGVPFYETEPPGHHAEGSAGVRGRVSPDVSARSAPHSIGDFPGPQYGATQRTPRHHPHGGFSNGVRRPEDRPGRVSSEGYRRNRMSNMDRKEFYRRLLFFVVFFVVFGVVLVWLRSS